MNRLYYLLLTALIACSAVQALDIKTDASYKKLVTAIEQAQKLEKCQAAWQKVTQSPAINAQDQQDMVKQALQLTHEQRTILQQELTHLGTDTKHLSNIKWGLGQLAFGTYLWFGELFTLSGIIIGKYVDTISGAHLAWPELWFCQKGYITKNASDITILSRLFAINPIVGSYCLYKAYKNLKKGMNYKQFLQDKITNLDAIISYLQSLQTK